jgi:methionyl aminopeptidase
MIKLKSSREAEMMRQAGKIAAAARALAGDMVKAGVTTKQIDTAVHDFIVSNGAVPTFLNYNGFPASICASVNEQVIHGIPDDRGLKDGDIVSIDVGATKDGYVGDCAATFIVGRGSREAERLIAVTRQSFFEGIKYAREGFRISDISHSIQSYVESKGFSVVREYVGHGIGASMHEPPEVPNFGSPGHGVRIVRGMTLAVEPMVNQGDAAIKVLKDRWTVVTLDGKLSAHYENTILVTDGEPEILTTTGDI